MDRPNRWFTDTDGLAHPAATFGKLPDMPQTVTIGVRKEYAALGDFLRIRLPRLRGLDIHLRPLFHEPDVCAPMWSLATALEEPAPLLENLHLRNFQRSWDHSKEVFLSDNLLAGSAPLLRSVGLLGVALHDRPYPVFTSVQNLSLSQSQVNISHILSYYPALEQLNIDAISLVSSGAAVSAEHLHLLHMPGTKQAAEIALGQLIITARLLTIWTLAVEDDLLAYVFSTAPKQNIHSIGIYIDVHSGQTAYALSYEPGPSWVIGLWQLWSAHNHPLRDTDTMAYPRTLTVHELAWPLIFASSRQLTRIELLLYCFGFAARDPDVRNDVAGVFVESSAGDAVPLHCPALEELSLSFLHSAARPLTVDVFDVLDFMAQRLHLPSAPLPLLTLRNVCLYDPAGGRGIALLTVRVGRVEYRGFKEPDLPYILQTNRTMSWLYPMMS